jgi:hypothetical protein
LLHSLFLASLSLLCSSLISLLFSLSLLHCCRVFWIRWRCCFLVLPRTVDTRSHDRRSLTSNEACACLKRV